MCCLYISSHFPSSSLASASSPDSTVCCMSLLLRVSAALHSQTGSQPSQWDTSALQQGQQEMYTFMCVSADSVLLCINMLTCNHVKEKKKKHLKPQASFRLTVSPIITIKTKTTDLYQTAISSLLWSPWQHNLTDDVSLW